MSQPSATQSQSSTVSLRRIVLGVTIIGLAAWYLLANKQEAREHRLYFSEDRPAISLRYDELSESWTEQTLRTRFPKATLRCYSNDDRTLGDRACALDVFANNDVPTMFIAFFFAKGQLSSASFNIPWWAHGDALDNLKAQFGEPHSAQVLFHGGVRLYGWELPDHGAVFYNRDRSLNPLQWNSVFWNSAAYCAKNRCFGP